MEYKPHLAYIPELPLLYQGLTVREHLQFTTMAYGISKEEYEVAQKQILERFDMTEHSGETPDGFSKGMRQKINVMAAFIHRARAFVIDEPFIGLDPQPFVLR